MTTQIGLEKDYTDDITTKLNKLLASYQVFYMNVRGYHWNVTGEQFFQLHVKFEELYTELVEQIDEIAERVLTLGNAPMHTYADFMEHSDVATTKNVTDGKACVQHILEGFSKLLTAQRDILAAAGDAGDEGTAAQMSDYISIQEKHVWMYGAFLG